MVAGPESWVVTVPFKLLPVEPGLVRVVVPEKLKQYNVEADDKLVLGKVTD